MEQVKIPYNVSYRNVKYPRLEFRMGNLLVVVPNGYDYKDLLKRKHKWIKKKEKFIDEILKLYKDKTLEERSESELKKIVYIAVDEYSEALKMKINNVSFKNMKTKWASISSKNNISINILMKLLPEYLIRYIVFHEVAHMIERNHGQNFWMLVQDEFKNFQSYERELYYFWFLINKKYLHFYYDGI